MKEIHVEKLITDEKMKKYQNTFIRPNQIKMIIDEDADVYTTDGRLLLRFRKNTLTKEKISKFYNAAGKYTLTNPTHNRGNTTGSKKKNVNDNPSVYSSILGYFDRWAPNHKHTFKQLGVKTPIEVRETAFSQLYPDKFKNTFPLLREVDSYYKQLVPKQYKKQRRKANETHFKIPGTSFTTITTNANFQTSIHTDRGDDAEGFGNLIVIERGNYTGGETCMPQYGIGVNVREGDILFMDVHEWHGNLPIKRENKDVVRMSIVCYLRKKVWERTRKKSKHFKEKHLRTLKCIKKKWKNRTKKKKKK